MVFQVHTRHKVDILQTLMIQEISNDILLFEDSCIDKTKNTDCHFPMIRQFDGNSGDGCLHFADGCAAPEGHPRSEVGGEHGRRTDRESKPSAQHPHRTHDTTDQWREILWWLGRFWGSCHPRVALRPTSNIREEVVVQIFVTLIS